MYFNQGNFFHKLKVRYSKVIFDRNTRKFIKFWKNSKPVINEKKTINQKIILIDLFDHQPWNIFHSFIVLYLKLKFNFNFSFFYFSLSESFFSKIKISIYRMSEIYKSFGVKNGISEFDLKKEVVPLKFRQFQNLSKNQLIELNYKGIKIGDLIYDTYLKTQNKPTVNLNDITLYKIYIKSISITNLVSKYYKNNKIALVIPSHTYYIQYGIVTRLALKQNIPVICIYSTFRGQKDFCLMKIDKKLKTSQDFKYDDYKIKFNKIKNKRKALALGKIILDERLKGTKKFNYLNKSPYKKSFKIIKTKYKKTVIFFAHDFFDAPHRFKKMLFADFYEQLIFFLKYFDKLNNYQFIIKPHPNSDTSNLKNLEKICSKFSNFKIISQNTNNMSLIINNPEFIITNHGSIGPEFAYHGIPVINTGESPYTQYKFTAFPKSINNLKNLIQNTKFLRKKIKFDKKKIYEFIYMNEIYNFKNYKKFNLNLETSFKNFQTFNNKKNKDKIIKNLSLYFDIFFKRILK